MAESQRLSSRIRLSNALQSLLWTSKVPKKSNMSNKSGFLSCGLLPFCGRKAAELGIDERAVEVENQSAAKGINFSAGLPAAGQIGPQF
jgi:hypothetical protein